jgi:hypothetical protein
VDVEAGPEQQAPVLVEQDVGLQEGAHLPDRRPDRGRLEGTLVALQLDGALVEHLLAGTGADRDPMARPGRPRPELRAPARLALPVDVVGVLLEARQVVRAGEVVAIQPGDQLGALGGLPAPLPPEHDVAVPALGVVLLLIGGEEGERVALPDVPVEPQVDLVAALGLGATRAGELLADGAELLEGAELVVDAGEEVAHGPHLPPVAPGDEAPAEVAAGDGELTVRLRRALLGDEVDHARHGVASVEARGGSADDLHPLDVIGRDVAQVHDTVDAAPKAAAVDQDGHFVGVEPLHAHGAGAERELLVATDVEAGDLSQHVLHVDRGGLPDDLLRDDLRRYRGVPGA